MNTGHDGGIGTIHANSSRDALARLETMVLMAGLDLPSRAIREQIVSALHLLVHVRRYDDGVRRIESISEITGLEGLTPLMQELFVFQRRGRAGPSRDRALHGDGRDPADGRRASRTMACTSRCRCSSVRRSRTRDRPCADAATWVELAAAVVLVCVSPRRLTLDRLADMVGAEAEPEKREDQLLGRFQIVSPAYRSLRCRSAASWRRSSGCVAGLPIEIAIAAGAAVRRDRAPGRGAGR